MTMKGVIKRRISYPLMNKLHAINSRLERREMPLHMARKRLRGRFVSGKDGFCKMALNKFQISAIFRKESCASRGIGYAHG